MENFIHLRTPIILDKNNKFMISSIFKENERLDENKIGIDLLNFMNSINTSE